MSDAPLLVEHRGSVAVVTLNRPRVHNALNAAVLADLRGRIKQLNEDRAVRAVVITGAGEKAFCAGADLDELASLDAATAKETLAVGQAVMADVAATRVPVIAAVNGLALGGGFELVLASTFAVFAEHASCGLPESGLGLIPGYGGTQRLPRIIGRAAAAHVMLTGSRLSADRAHQLGLTPVPPVPAAGVVEAAVEIAELVAAKGPAANAAILEAVQTTDATPHDLALETALAGLATGGAEAAEGIAAFKERRPPKFGPRPGPNTPAASAEGGPAEQQGD